MDIAFPGYGSTTAIWSLLVAALLGFLIGLERERKREISGSIIAGIRTFPIIAVFGSIVGELTVGYGVAVLVAGFFAITLMAGLSYMRESAGEKI
ncbi:MAG TPA: MgtC/SapB family protein, partial [Deinococcales bacterium]|nr:MgtC/SapB family protein [Deinococcales bacterium]